MTAINDYNLSLAESANSRPVIFRGGVLMVLSGAACIFLDETKDKDLDDIPPQKHRRGGREITELDKL